jgi:branched-chain amino acid transport system ATP-binding protein
MGVRRAPRRGDRAPAGAAALRLVDLTLRFEGVTALRDVSFDVVPGELFSVIGPNGAGKTTLFNCISGVYRPQHGAVLIDDTSISGWRPHRIAAAGVARTFQNVEVFPSMTVIDNLTLGRYHHLRSGLLRGALFVGPAVREEITNRAKVEDIVELLEIEHLRNALVGSLPHGLRKRVELGRALAMEPRLLLLDEPVAGMNQEETEDMVRFVLDVHEELDMTIVLVEHDMGVVMDVSDRIAVLNFGELVAIGAPAEVAADPDVITSYLGTSAPGAPA